MKPPSRYIVTCSLCRRAYFVRWYEPDPVVCDDCVDDAVTTLIESIPDNG